MSMWKVNRLGHGLIRVLLSSLAWIVVCGILCTKLGILAAPIALVVTAVGGTITALAILAPDRLPDEQPARDSYSAMGRGLSWGEALNRQDAAPSRGLHSSGGRQEDPMYRCAICHFEMELDDVAVEVGNGRGVCLHCYARETSTQRPMPSTLRQTLHVMLAGLSVGLRSTGGRQQGSRYCCAICHFGMELDDVAVEVGNGRGVCLRCYARETSTQRPMPNTLRRALQVTLAGFSVR